MPCHRAHGGALTEPILPQTNGLRRRILLSVWLLMLAGAALYADGWPTDNRVERWGSQLSHDEGWEILRRDFGGDEAVLIRLDQFEPEGPGGTEARAAMKRWSSELDSEASVLEVVDATRVIGGWPWEPGGTDVQRELALALDLWRREPASLDVILRIKSSASPQERSGLAQRIDDRITAAAQLGIRMRAAGHPLVSAALDREARRVERTFVPLLVLLAALGAWAFLRSMRLAALALLPAATASVGARAFARAFIGPSDLILVAAGPITFVVVLAATLHLVLRFQYYCGLPRGDQRLRAPEAARLACRDKAMATSLAAVTTAIGFAVFRVSSLQSVVHLGSLVAGTVILATPLILYGTSYLLAGMTEVPAGPVSSTRPWRRLAAWSARRRTAIAALGIATLVAGGLSPRYLEAATNGVAYFEEDHPVRVQFEALEAEGAGLSSAEVLVQHPGDRPWELSSLGANRLADPLGAVPGASGVIGPEVFLGALSPGLRAVAAPALLRRAGRLDEAGRTARWTVRFATGESAATSRLLAGLKDAAETAFPGARVYVTGSVPRLHAMQDTLVGTLATSLALTLLVTTLLFVFVTRSAREVVAVLAVNLVPVAAILAFAAIAGIPLDGATTMVGAVVLGLAVDNTFHLIHAAGGQPRSNRARLGAFASVGGAATVGSVSLALGFSTLILSGFAPTARFGGLCAVGAMAAWVSDLVLLPALLPWRRRK